MLARRAAMADWSRPVPSPQAFQVSSPVFRFQRNRRPDPNGARSRRDLLSVASAIDELLPDSPSLQGYVVCEIDESLTAPLVKWLSKKSN